MEDNEGEAGWSALHSSEGQNRIPSPTMTTSESLASRLAVEPRSQVFPPSVEDSRSRLSPEAFVGVEEGEPKNDIPHKIRDRKVPHNGEDTRRSRRRKGLSYYPSSSSSPFSFVSGKRHGLLFSPRRIRSLTLSLILASIVFLVVRHFVLKCGRFLPRTNLSYHRHQASLATAFREGHIPRHLASPGGGEGDRDQPDQTASPQEDVFASLTPSTAASSPECYGGENALEGDTAAEEEGRQQEQEPEAPPSQGISSSSEGSPSQSDERNPGASTSSSSVESPSVIASPGSSVSSGIEEGVSPQQAAARPQRKRRRRTDPRDGSTSSSCKGL